MTTRLRCAIDSATTLLADAGVSSPRYDAEELAAHLAGIQRGRLPLIKSPDDTFFDRYQRRDRGAIAAGTAAAHHRHSRIRAVDAVRRSGRFHSSPGD